MTHQIPNNVWEESWHVCACACVCLCLFEWIVRRGVGDVNITARVFIHHFSFSCENKVLGVHIVWAPFNCSQRGKSVRGRSQRLFFRALRLFFAAALRAFDVKKCNCSEHHWCHHCFIYFFICFYKTFYWAFQHTNGCSLAEKHTNVHAIIIICQSLGSSRATFLSSTESRQQQYPDKKQKAKTSSNKNSITSPTFQLINNYYPLKWLIHCVFWHIVKCIRWAMKWRPNLF